MRTGHFLKNSKNYLNPLATQFLNIFKDREMFHVCMYEGFLEGGKSENKSYAKIPKCTSICGDQRWKYSKYPMNGMWLGCWLTSWISSWEVWRKVGTGYFWAGWMWTESFLLISLGRGIASKRDILRPRDCRWLRSNGSQGLGFEAHIEIEWILCPSLKHKSFNFLNTNPWMVDCPGPCVSTFSLSHVDKMYALNIFIWSRGGW